MKKSNHVCFFIFPLFFQSCYTVEQGYEQFRLFSQEKQIKKIISEKSETPQRIEKLKLIEPTLKYAEQEVGLNVGSSYQQYIALNRPHLLWVVQAAQKHSLELKTWWFPIVGKQPYLGYFNYKSALEMKNKLSEKKYDVLLAGVNAFSLLGYFSDPIYSSMIDHWPTPQMIETLFHECLHKTIYVKNHYAFNENLANFVARKATEQFMRTHGEFGQNADVYVQNYEKEKRAQIKFQEFLLIVRKDLQDFYQNNPHDASGEDLFLKKREEKFDEIALRYKTFMNGVEEGTNYAFAFQKGKINNAVVLAYSIYDAAQEPLERAFARLDHQIQPFVTSLKRCLAKQSPQNEDELWALVENCPPTQ